MAWANSKIFRQHIADMIGNTTAYDYDADSVKAALYNNTTAPDNDVTAANATYAVDQWVVGNEVSQGGQWAVGGIALASKTVLVNVADQVTVDAADTASGSAATLAAVFGTLVYDDTLSPKTGFSYNYFGGTNSVTNGTFTIVWNANGIMRYTL